MSNAISGSSSTMTMRWIALSRWPNNIYGSRLPRTGSGSVTSKPAVGARAGQPSAANFRPLGPAEKHQESHLPPPRPPARDDSREGQRIAKLLARAGIASRREIERMIAEGRIAIGGIQGDTPATLLTSLHGVTVDGKAV